ncbi:MAG: DNA methyltransferase [Patescibacteria group bacterium]
MKYVFILGKNPELSTAEIVAVLPQVKIITQKPEYLVIDGPKIDGSETINRLGGTIKIGIFLSQCPDIGPVLGVADSLVGQRFIFGFSFYGQRTSNWGLAIKKILKEKGISSRLVTSSEPALSSVIVTKEKCHDFLISPDFFAQTIAVQDFADYSHRDFDRPSSDAVSGMLPPKAAKMMINLSGAKADQIILDPFCGSGTILSEAIVLGFNNLVGCDLSPKAVIDTKDNLDWLRQEISSLRADAQIFIGDASRISEKIKINSIDAIVTEPYLGPPIKGNESSEKIATIIAELGQLYLASIIEFKKVLVKGGRLVMVFPQWHLHNQVFSLGLLSRLTKLGFKRLDRGNLFYKRPEQKVWRQIIILEK